MTDVSWLPSAASVIILVTIVVSVWSLAKAIKTHRFIKRTVALMQERGYRHPPRVLVYEAEDEW